MFIPYFDSMTISEIDQRSITETGYNEDRLKENKMAPWFTVEPEKIYLRTHF